MNRSPVSRGRLALLASISTMLFFTQTTSAFAAEQCFHEAGTYGNLTVTRTGACGNTLNYGGITGVWMGTGTTSSTCTYTLTTPLGGVSAAGLKVNMTAHSNDINSYGEHAEFLLNTVKFPILAADLDNSFPTGGIPLTAEPNGDVSSTAGDGRGTVAFSRFTDTVNSITINHNRIIGSPNGTIYRVCVDDAGQGDLGLPTVDSALVNTAQPTITGTYDATNNTALTVTIDNVTYTQGVPNNGLTVNPNGTWSLDLSVAGQSLADNTYDVSVSSTDGTTTTNDSSSNELVVDTTAPIVALVTPADMSASNDTTPTLSGTVDDVNATVSVVISDANGMVVQTQTPTVDAMGNWSVDATQLPEGTYTVVATATDAATNVGTSSTHGWTIDTTPPAVAIDAPTDGTQTNDNTPTVTGTTEPNTAVSVSINDANGTVEVITVTSDAMGNWSVDTAQLPDGAYTAVATATDAATNSASTNAVGFEVDTIAPAVTLATPLNMTVTNNNILTASGTVEPNATLVVTIIDANGMVVQTLMPTADGAGNWSADATQLPEGTYTVVATATDAATNTNQAGPHTATIDQTPPSVTLTGPADNSITNDDTPALSGTVEPGATVSVVISDANGMVVQTQTPTVDAMGNWSVDATQLPEGTYTAVATATDAATNSASTTGVGFEIDTTPPALAISTPAMGTLLDTRDVDVTGTSDLGQDVTIEIIDANGNVVDTQTAATDANGAWTIQTQGLANGLYTARAKTTDTAGNSTTVEQQFNVDSTEPMIQIVEPANDSTTSETKPAITGTTDVDATVNIIIKDAAGATIATFTPTVDAAGNWSVTPDQDLVDGDYTIEATATRPNNKMATATNTVTIDTVGPITTIVTPADGMVGNANQPEITGTSEPGATVDVSVTNAAGTVVFEGQTTADDQGNWTITPDAPLADDTYSVDAKGTDAAGNEGTPTTAGFTVDTNAPIIMITTPSNGDTIDDSTPTITGVAEPDSVVKIFIDGVEVGEVTADSMGNWSYDVSDDQALGEGEHKIEATSTDDAGNSGTSGELTVTFEKPKAPITITTPTEGETVTGPSVTVTGTGEPGEEVIVTINGNPTTVTVDENGNWTTTIDDVPDGQSTIEAKSGDRDATVIVTIASTPDAAKYIVTGGVSCSSTQGTPTPSLLLLVLLGFFGCRRIRRR